MIDTILNSKDLYKFGPFGEESTLTNLDMEYVKETEEALSEYYEDFGVVMVLEDRAGMTSLVYVTEDDFEYEPNHEGVYIVNAKVYSNVVPNGEYGTIGIRSVGGGVERVY